MLLRAKDLGFKGLGFGTSWSRLVLNLEGKFHSFSVALPLQGKATFSGTQIRTLQLSDGRLVLASCGLEQVSALLHCVGSRLRAYELRPLCVSVASHIDAKVVGVGVSGRVAVCWIYAIQSLCNPESTWRSKASLK